MTTGYINIPPVGSPSWKSPVASAVDLPPSGNTIGDARVTEDTSLIYIWTGSAWTSSGGGGSGTVTSVALADGSSTPIYSITGSPVTGAGTLTFSLVPQSPALVFAGPISGSAAVPSFRSLVLTDLPALNYVTSVSGTAPIVSSGGYTPTISITQATTSTNGYLSSTDWNTFNNKQPAGSYISALSGDGTATGPGSVTFTLATVNSSPGTFAISTVTVNSKGLVTSATAASTTGTGSVVLANSPTLITPALGTPSSITLTNGTGLPLSTGVTGILPIANGGTGQSTANAGFAALSPLTTNGDIITQTSGVPARVGIGTTGQLLTVVAGAPTWQTASPYAVQTINSTTSAVAGITYNCNTSGGAFTVTLPAPVINTFIVIKDSTGSFGTNALTLAPNGSEMIEGLAANKVFQSNWGSWSIYSDGTNWFLGAF